MWLLSTAGTVGHLEGDSPSRLSPPTKHEQPLKIRESSYGPPAQALECQREARKRVAAHRLYFRHKPFPLTPYPLESLLSTYVFVSMIEEDSPQWRMSADNPGFLKLGPRHGRDTTPAWENIYGLFQASNDFKRGAFLGLMPYDDGTTSLPPIDITRERPNLRRFDLLTSYEKHVPLKGHALDVLDAVDDNGNNYIVMMLEYCVVDSNCISYMAKKQVSEGERVGLTESERMKLGITLTLEEVERLATEGEV
ncbi:hypothetical protein C8R44DRAFT_916586 [Mycena epipterygia]|nr:hypothetical protein C8R44DRAFT_916586 [Mycena epipterygia]